MRFAIRFVSASRTRWKWVGRGELEVTDAQLLLNGRRHRWFLPGAPQQVAIPLTDVRNVAQRGKSLSCEVQPGPPDQTLRFHATDAAAAAQIAALLPKDRTPEFERHQGEQQAFDSALQALEARALVTPALVLANVGVFAAVAYAGGGWWVPEPAVLIRWGSNYGPYTLDGEWWRLFTCMFLHFGVLHLALNMWALWSVGRLTERLFGSVTFLLLYLFAGLCGSLSSTLWHPLVNAAGASGAIFGVLGALLAFMVNPRTRIPASVAAPQRNSALVFVAYNLFNGFTHAGIDNAAHIGGLLGGFTLGWLLARPLAAEERGQTGSHLGLGVGAAAVVLLALSWPVLHPAAGVAAERHFTHELMHFGLDEGALLGEQQSLSSMWNRRAINDAELGRRLNESLVPRWQAAEERLNAAALPPGSGFGELRSQVLAYVSGSRTGLTLVAAGVTQHQPQQRAEGERLLQLANARGETISALMRQLY